MLILAAVTYYPFFSNDDVFIRSARKKHNYAESMTKRLEKEGKTKFNHYIEARKRKYVREYTPAPLLEKPDFSGFQLQ